MPFFEKNIYRVYILPYTANPEGVEPRPIRDIQRNPNGFNKYEREAYYNRPWSLIAMYGARVGLSTYWKMFSPPWKSAYKFELFAIDDNAEEFEIKFDNLAFRHRNERSFLDAHFFDFKLARTLSNVYYSYLSKTKFHQRYLQRQCELAREQFDWVPEKIRFQMRLSSIPLPSEKGDWDPLQSEFPHIKISEIFRCDSKTGLAQPLREREVELKRGNIDRI